MYVFRERNFLLPCFLFIRSLRVLYIFSLSVRVSGELRKEQGIEGCGEGFLSVERCLPHGEGDMGRGNDNGSGYIALLCCKCMWFTAFFWRNTCVSSTSILRIISYDVIECDTSGYAVVSGSTR